MGRFYCRSGVAGQPRFRAWHDGTVAELGRARYISLTTFRRDGSPVATPVWLVADAGRLYVWTGAQTGKVKRIRRNPDATVAPCTVRGAVTGPAVAARAQIMQQAGRPDIWRLFLAKYGLQLRAIIWAEQARSRLRRRQPDPAARIYLELTLTDSGAP
jgi:PPOX class probable F420-dependent enzyme